MDDVKKCVIGIHNQLRKKLLEDEDSIELGFEKFTFDLFIARALILWLY